VTLSGWFHVIWGDAPHYVLFDGSGRSTELVIGRDVMAALGGPSALDRQRVKVVAAPAAAPPGAMRVITIERDRH
jgi:hypothetical protein